MQAWLFVSVKMAETLTKREWGRAALPFGTLFAF